MKSTNPATGEVIWEGTAQTVEEAIQAAKQSAWPKLSLAERIKHLQRFKQRLEENADHFAEAISKEMGKPLWESKMEVAAMCGKVDISIEAYEERCPERVSHIEGADLVIRHKPHGICGVIGPFNFPGHLPNGHIVPALLAGNTVIFKPSEHTPMVGEMLVELWDLPKGALNLVHDQALAKHPDLNALFFTGSARVGLELSKFYGNHPEKLLALEMGGNNPLVIADPDNLEKAAEQTIKSAFTTSGQRCTCARRLIVVDNEPFIEVLHAKMEKITVGPYTEEPFMGPLINADNVRKQAGLKGEGPYIKPTLIEPTHKDEEIFGPILQLIRVPNFDAAVQEANNTAFGLVAALFSRDRKLWERFDVKAGVINWNRPTTGASSRAPFGGIGLSGNHRPAAYYAADYCSYPTASMEASSL